MRELGYVEGKNLVIEWRFADNKYERLPGLAAELVRLNVEVLVSHSTPGTEALVRATTTIPIVLTAVADPVGSGFASSLARPDKNITGLSLVSADLTQKHVELLKIMVPALSRLGVLTNSGSSFHPSLLKSVQAAAQARGVQVVSASAATPEEIERGYAKLARERANAAIALADSFFLSQLRQIADLAVRHRIPTLYAQREYALQGGLISYGIDIRDAYRRAATYVDKILKGAKPGDLPIEQPTKIHLAINRKTAKALGLTIPQEMLLRANEVID